MTGGVSSCSLALFVRAQVPDPLRLPELCVGVPRVGGPVPELRRRGTASSRRSSATTHAVTSRGPRDQSRRRRRRSRMLTDTSVAPDPDRHRRDRPRARRRPRAGFGRARRAGSRGSASRRCCSRSRQASSKRAGVDVLYASGEESTGQVRLRAGRLGLLERPAGERVRVVAEPEIGRIGRDRARRATGAA